MRRSIVVVASVLLGAAALGACAAPEYTADAARRDMQRAGLTRAQADCVLNALRQRYAQQYIDAQRNAMRARGLDPGTAAINQREVDLYVRNKLAGQDRVGNDETSFARRVTQECRSKPCARSS